MTTLRAMVVDDEPLAVERMCGLLGRIPEVAVVATGASGREAIERLTAGGIDILFLDVEMPQLDGFDLIEALARRGVAVPYVVLVTAHDYHAPMAFDSGVLDFLTKPVRLARLEKAVARVVTAIHQAGAADRVEALAGQLAELRRTIETEPSDFLWVQRRGGSVRIDLRAIERVQAERDYVRLFVAGEDYLHRDSLTAIAARLEPERYLRIHRSSVVDRGAIVGVRRRPTGSYQVTLRDGAVLPVGRNYRGVVLGLASNGG